MDTMTTLARVDATGFKDWMTANGWTVRTLAHRFGVGDRTVQRWRDGTSRVPPYIELALDALGPRPPSAGSSSSGEGTPNETQDALKEPPRSTE